MTGLPAARRPLPLLRALALLLGEATPLLTGVVQVAASLLALAPPPPSPALPVCSLGFTLLHLPLQALRSSQSTQPFSDFQTSLRIPVSWGAKEALTGPETLEAML